MEREMRSKYVSYNNYRITIQNYAMNSVNKIQVQENDETKGRENEFNMRENDVSNMPLKHYEKTWQRENEVTESEPRHSTYFVNEIDGDADSRKRKQGFAWVP